MTAATEKPIRSIIYLSWLNLGKKAGVRAHTAVITGVYGSEI